MAESNYWMIKRVPATTRLKIKAHAKANHLTIAGVIIKMAEKL